MLAGEWQFPWWVFWVFLAVVVGELIVVALPAAIPWVIIARRRGYRWWQGALAGVALFAAVAIPTALILPVHKHLGLFAGWLGAWAVLVVVARRVKIRTPS